MRLRGKIIIFIVVWTLAIIVVGITTRYKRGYDLLLRVKGEEQEKVASVLGVMVAEVGSTVKTPLSLVILLTTRFPVPVFEMVKICWPEEPMATSPKSSAVGEISISGFKLPGIKAPRTTRIPI